MASPRDPNDPYDMLGDVFAQLQVDSCGSASSIRASCRGRSGGSAPSSCARLHSTTGCFASIFRRG